MLTTTNNAATLKAVEICACQARNIGRVATEGAAAETVILVIAREVQHRRQVDIEAEHPQDSCGQLAEFARELGHSGITHGLRRRHRLADVAKAVNEAAFLINADQDAMPNGIANLRAQKGDLRWRFDISFE
jgi:hypothetical protein